MAAIFYLSAQSSPPTPGALPDKVAHAIEYFGLGVLVFRAVAGGLGAHVSTGRAMATMIITVAYAVSDTDGNVYFGSHGALSIYGAAGLAPEDSPPACIVRIKKGEGEFDPD